MNAQRYMALAVYFTGVVAHLVLVFALRGNASEVVTVWLPGFILTAITYGVIFFLGHILGSYPRAVLGQSTETSRHATLQKRNVLYKWVVAGFLVHMLVWPLSRGLLEWTGRALFVLCSWVIVWLFYRVGRVAKLHKTNQQAMEV